MCFCDTEVYASLSLSTSPMDNKGTRSDPVEVPTKISYSIFFSWIKNSENPPAKAPFEPPPDITNALIKSINAHKYTIVFERNLHLLFILEMHENKRI